MSADTPPAPPPAVVQTVVVRSARLPEPAGDPAFSIVRIDPAALQSAPRLDEALESAPGVSLFRRTSSLGANPTTQGISLRAIAGSGASRALVTLDGVPQNDPFGGWVIWSALPPETIAAATVVRGAGAGPYGAGALTGVVALDSLDAVPGELADDVSVGELGDERAAVVADVPAGGGRLLLDAAGESSDGWIPVRYGAGAADRPLTLHDWTTAAREQLDLGAGVLAGRVAAFDEDRGAGTVDAYSRERGVQGSLTLAAQPTPAALGYRLQSWVEVTDLLNASASVAANRDTATQANVQYTTPAVGVGLNAAVRRGVGSSSIEVGADVRDYDGATREHLFSQGTPTGSRVSGGGEVVAGVYAEGSDRLGPWLLTGGARLDGWANYAGELIQHGASPLDIHYGDRGGAVPTARVGVRRDFSPAFYLRSAAYAGFRPATLNELYRTFRVGSDATEANAGLSPERLYGAEIGAGGASVLTWDADLFYNQLANAITNVTIGKGPGSFPVAGFVPAGGTLFQRMNAGRVNAYGLEGEVERRLGQRLDLRIAADLTHARVDGGSQAPQLTGLRPAETPEATVTATAAWKIAPPLTVFATLRYESARYDDDQNTRRIAPGTGVDARLEWRIAGGVMAFVGAENLFDADIQTGRSAANVVTYDAPRIVSVGLALRR